jgi:hypothetical protein
MTIRTWGTKAPVDMKGMAIYLSMSGTFWAWLLFGEKEDTIIKHKKIENMAKIDFPVTNKKRFI